MKEYVPVPIPVPVYVPVPMNLYAQATPTSVAIPVPVRTSLSITETPRNAIEWSNIIHLLLVRYTYTMNDVEKILFGFAVLRYLCRCFCPPHYRVLRIL